MAFGTTRDVLLVIRAKDQASRVVTDMGRTFSGLDKKIRDANRAFNEQAAIIRKNRQALKDSHYESQRMRAAEIKSIRDVGRARLDEIRTTIKSEELRKVKMAQARGQTMLQVQAVEKLALAEKEEFRARIRQLDAEMAAGRAIRDQHINEAAAITDTIHRRQALGGSMVTLGATTAAFGAAALTAYGFAVKGAIDYNKQVALTSTQMSKIGANQKQIHDLGLEMTRSIAVPLKEIQPALYDIFSSYDVNFAQAKVLAIEFAKAAVAGNVSMQEAGRGVLEILNAFGLKYTDVNRVLDIQFQMVRRGIGTYKDFATALGLSTSTAHNANQSFEEMAGAVAFMTRMFGGHGRSAAISYARIIELLTKPAAAKNLHQIGIEVYDAHGKTRQLSDIMGQLYTKFGKMSDAARASTFKEVFGTSTIQARRFFDQAVKNFPLLKSLIDSTTDSQGSLNAAYGVMADTPANKIQLLKNNFSALRVEMGEAVLPAVLKLVDVFTGLFQKFNALDPATKKAIYIFGAVAASGMLVVGALIAIGGGVLILAGAFAALDGAMLPIIAVMAAVIAVVAGLGAVIFYTAKHWDKYGPRITKAWQAVEQAFIDSLPVIGRFFQAVLYAISLFIKAWVAMVKIFLGTLGSMISGLGKFLGWAAKLGGPFASGPMKKAADSIKGVGDAMTDLVNGVSEIGNTFADVMWEIGTAAGNNLANSFIKGASGIQAGQKALLGRYGEDIPLGKAVTAGGKQVVKARKVGGTGSSSTTGGNFDFGSIPNLIPDDAKKGSTAKKAAEANRKAVLAAQTSFSREMRPIALLWAKFAKVPAQEIIAGIGPVSKAATALADGIEEAWKKKIGKLKGTMPKEIADLVKAMRARASEAQKFRDDVFKAAMGGGIIDAGNAAKEQFGEITSGGVKAMLQQKLAATKKFATDLKKLAQSGLDPAFIKEIALAGVDAGGPIAAALAAGPASDIKAINDIQKQIQSAARGVATTAELSLYGPGQLAIQGLINGIKSKFPEVKAVLQELTKLMQQWKGPESVDRRLLVPNGQVIMSGLVDGLYSGYGDVRQALRDMTMDIGNRVQPVGGGRRPSAETLSRNVDINMPIYTQEIDPVKHAADLGWEVARRLR